MRGLLVLGIALILAGSAAAQEKRISVAPPGAAKAGLRGPEGAAQAPEAEPLAAPLVPPPVAAPQPDPSACRTQCAQAYYFCLSGSDDQCPDRWARCVLDCGPVPPPAS